MHQTCVSCGFFSCGISGPLRLKVVSVSIFMSPKVWEEPTEVTQEDGNALGPSFPVTRKLTGVFNEKNGQQKLKFKMPDQQATTRFSAVWSWLVRKYSTWMNPTVAKNLGRECMMGLTSTDSMTGPLDSAKLTRRKGAQSKGRWQPRRLKHDRRICTATAANSTLQ